MAVSVLPHPAPPPEALSLRGLAAVAGLAIPVLTLEKFDALARAAPSERPDLVELTPALLAGVGWTAGQADAILRALGFVRVKKADPADPSLWRRRAFAPRPPAAAPAPVRPPVAAALRAAHFVATSSPGAEGTPPSSSPPGLRRNRDVRLNEAQETCAQQTRNEAQETCRADVWLWRARFFKTRSLAARIIEDGGVRTRPRRRPRPARQTEPLAPPRRRGGLRPRAALARRQGRGARRTEGPGARGAGALQLNRGERRRLKGAVRTQFGRGRRFLKRSVDDASLAPLRAVFTKRRAGAPHEVARLFATRR